MQKSVVAERTKPRRTFRRTALEESFLTYCQLSSDGFAPVVQQSTLATLQNEAANRIHNAFFLDKSAEREILGTELLLLEPSKPISKSVRLTDMAPQIAGLCERALLKPQEERELFQRMNYLRFRAEAILLSKTKQLCQWDIERVRGLLRAANWHRDQIVQANLRLVISIVKKFAGPICSFDDLLSEGILALMRAVEKFDYDRGFRFSTYATQVVRRNSYKMCMERQDERQKVNVSLSEPGVDFSAQEPDSPATESRWNQLRSRLGELLDQLDRREKLIVRARFSLGGHRRVQTLQRLANALGVSKERIRQLEKRAVDKLRALAIEAS